MKGPPPLFLLSGMGADARVFAAQLDAIPTLVVPDWIEPEKGDTLATYGERFARLIDPGVPCYVGGASFGGFVALEMAGHLDTVACFLIGSVRSPEEFPSRIKLLTKVPGGPAPMPFQVASMLSKVALASSGTLASPTLRELMSQMSVADADFMRWACRAVLEWEAPADIGGLRICQIHGEKDRILPCENTRADVVIPGAGHAISISHPDAVTRFLQENCKA